jgi:formate hydrogenlyase subunit 3/multisubunit Na+/H+ antiporter MnhD subunit
MTTKRNDREAHAAEASATLKTSAPRSRRLTWRRAALVMLLGFAALVAMTLFSFWLLWYFDGDIVRTERAIQSLKPWLMAVQLVALGLMWQFWGAFAPWLCRRCKASSALPWLLREKRRVFMLLGCYEALVVLRFLMS